MLFGVQTNEEDERVRELQALRMGNGSITSPSLKQLVTNSVDGKGVLKGEIAESNQRLMQIKHGMGINELISKGIEGTQQSGT
jgi:hypothetical protein